MKAIVRCSDGWRVAELMVTEGLDYKVKFWWGGADKGWMNFVNHGCVYGDADEAICAMTAAHDTENVTPDSWFPTLGGMWLIYNGRVCVIVNKVRDRYWGGKWWCKLRSAAKQYGTRGEAEAEIRCMLMPPNENVPWFCQHTTGFGLEADGRSRHGIEFPKKYPGQTIQIIDDNLDNPRVEYSQIEHLLDGHVWRSWEVVK